jgi:hypothetical protein
MLQRAVRIALFQLKFSTKNISNNMVSKKYVINSGKGWKPKEDVDALDKLNGTFSTFVLPREKWQLTL